MNFKSILLSLLGYLTSVALGMLAVLVIQDAPRAFILYSAGVALLFAAGFLACNRLHLRAELQVSVVSGFEGTCLPTGLNRNGVLLRLDGFCSGFFRKARKLPGLPLYYRTGCEFHGKFENGRVVTTERRDELDLNVQGTSTGRFSCAEGAHHVSNTPKSA